MSKRTLEKLLLGILIVIAAASLILPVVLAVLESIKKLASILHIG